MMNYVMTATAFLRAKMNRFLHEEKGAVDIVAIVVLVGIAVALAIVFRNQIGKLLKDILDGVSTNASGAAGTIEPIK